MEPHGPPKGATAGSKDDTFAGFTEYLSQYAKAWPLLIACLVGPMNKYLHAVPVYKAHENLLAGATSLYGFLLAAALFHYRPVLFKIKPLAMAIPAVLIAVSALTLLHYYVLVQASVREQGALLGELGVIASQLSTEDILSRTGFENIPRGVELLCWYLGGFLAAETSLVTLALSEYVGARSS